MTDVELEWRLVYAVVVAGKSAAFANRAIAELRRLVHVRPPLAAIAVRPDYLRVARTGRYRTVSRAIEHLARHRPDLRTCAPGELERTPGIGPKTARFFVAWTRPDARVAVLDRHVLRWLEREGYAGVPRSTPTGRAYAKWEGVFLEEADRREVSPRELDLEIWAAAATAENVA